MHEIMSSTENKTPVKLPDSDKPTPGSSSGTWDSRTPLTSPFEYFDGYWPKEWVRESEAPPSSPESPSPAAVVVRCTKIAGSAQLVELPRKRSAESDEEEEEESRPSKRRTETYNAIRVARIEGNFQEESRLRREREAELELARQMAVERRERQEWAERKQELRKIVERTAQIRREFAREHERRVLESQVEKARQELLERSRLLEEITKQWEDMKMRLER